MEKKLIYFIITIVCLFLSGCEISSPNDNKYNVTISPNPTTICGKTIYITDFTANDKLYLSDLINEIEYICSQQNKKEP